MKVNILGVSTTEFGELWNKSPRALARQAIEGALNDAKLNPEDIDAIYVGNMLAGILGNQANLGPFFAEELGIPVPAIRVEGACASGGLALNSGVNGILSGQYETVLVLGIEKMTDSSQDDVTTGLMAAGSDNERMAGATFPGIYALMAQAYMDKYKVTEETIAAVSVKNHYHGSLNDKAQFRKPITVADVMKSSRIADPLKLLDCSPISDGASAVVISSKEVKNAPFITASEVGSDKLALHDRKSYTSLGSVISAAERAYKKTGLKPMDIQVAEIHDCFSIAEAIAVEDLGFSEKGMGAIDISKGKMTIGKGKIITNPSGGLKACGHPVGATGIKQVVEITTQLRGKAGDRQVKGSKIGLTHNVGGSGAVAAVHIIQI